MVAPNERLAYAVSKVLAKRLRIVLPSNNRVTVEQEATIQIPKIATDESILRSLQLYRLTKLSELSAVS